MTGNRAPSAPPRHGWRRQIPLVALSLLVGAAATLSALVVPTTVRSEGALAHVGFGWPLPWSVQDHSGVGYFRFPVDVGFASRRVPSDIETTYDAGAFLADTVVIALAAFLVLSLVIALIRRRR
ncbi:hypothetical protein [Microbacterium sp.]|uniref:hypothetical protein n=1 Tax=Microbacterium sp. TaxID=51671 RepID=UPI00333E790B